MSTKNRQSLISTFSTGHIATQANFTAFIDSTLNFSSDNIHVDSNQNLGLGINTLNSRFTIAGKAGTSCTGTISLTKDSSQITCTGTKLTTELTKNDFIEIEGNSQVFRVTAIPPNDTTLSLSPLPEQTVSGNFKIVYPLIELINSAGNTVLTVTPNGFMGIGTASPSAPLDVNGTINAVAFNGNGATITNLNPANISGKIPKDKLPSEIGEKPLLFTTNTPVTEYGNSILIKWKASDKNRLVITYLKDEKINILDSSKSEITSPSGNLTITPTQNMTITLTAYNLNNEIIDQQQINLLVSKQKAVNKTIAKANANNVLIQNILIKVATTYNLETRNRENVTILARGLQSLSTITPGEIFKELPRFYNSIGETWNPALNQDWIIKAIT